jgi:cysteine desulfuration protein SufE
MKRLPERLESLLATLEPLERGERIQLLVDMAKRFRRVAPEIATRPYPADHRVPGCESEAYVWAEPNQDGTLAYSFAVENPQGISAMSLATILRESLSGAPLEEVAEIPGEIIYRIYGRELSMGKSLGLMGMVNMVRIMARKTINASAGHAAS